MKITQNTPDLLVVENRPVILGIALIVFILAFVAIGLAMVFSGEWTGLAFILLGGGLGFLAFFAFVRRVQVVFHRPEGWVEIRRRNLLGASTIRHRLVEIDHADVEVNHGSDSTTYRVILLISKGQSAGSHPLTLAYSNVGNPHGIAADINDWLTAAR